jgi:hypothetical protein
VRAIRLLPEYGACPIWLYDATGDLLANDLPPELKAVPEIVAQVGQIQDIFNSLYRDDPHVFEWIGFTNPEDREKYVALVRSAIALIKSTVGDRYDFRDDSDLDQFYR